MSTAQKYPLSVLGREPSYFEALFESLLEGVVVYDASGSVADFNPAASSLLESTPALLSKHNLFVPVPRALSRADGTPYTVDTMPAVVALRTGKPVLDSLMGIPSASGGAPSKWVMVNANPLFRGDATESHQVIVTLRDVSESVRMRQRTLESEALFKSIFENSPSGVILLDENRRFLKANRFYQELVGYTEVELQQKTIFDLVHPEELALTRTISDELVQEEFRVERLEKRHVRRDGKEVWVLITTQQLSPGNRILSVIEDFTEERKIREELFAQQALIESLAADIPGALLAMERGPDRNSKILFASEGVRAIYGLSPQEAIEDPRRLVAAIHPDDRAGLLKEIESTYLSPRVVSWTGRVQHPDGVTRWISISARAFRLASGRVRWSVMHVDQTEMRKLQSELMHASKLTALGEMAGGIAHEVNNPLAIIQGKAAMMRSRLANNRFCADDFTFDLERIEQTTIRIAKIVKNLKALARNAENESMQSVPISSLIEDALELCRERFKSENIQLNVSAMPSQNIECRPTQVGQILLNLLNNAHDAVEGLTERLISVDVEFNEARVCFVVSDNGHGVPTSAVERLMEPFFTTKPVGKGMGLGLSISKSLADGHGGCLRYEPAKNLTRFVLELPRKSADVCRS